MLSPAAKAGDVELPYLGNADVRWGSLRLDDLRTMAFSPDEQIEFSLRAGDVLICEGGEVGRCTVVEDDLPGVHFQKAIHRVRCDDQLSPHYLYRYMRYAAETGRLDDVSSQATIKHLTGVKLRSIPIPLPPIEEQRRIAAVLDAADALRAKRRDALAKLGTLAQSIFIEMFGELTSVDWLPIEAVAAPGRGSIRTGPFGSQLLHEEFTDSGIAVLGIDNAVNNIFAWGQRRFITEEKYQKLRRYTVLSGDVIITIMGTCGRVAVVPDGMPTAVNTKHLCCITLDRDRCLPEYLWACLIFHPRVCQQLGATHGAVMPGLNMGRIKQAEIPLPSIDIQGEFVSKKVAVQRQLDYVQKSREDIDNLFASLQQRAFKGELWASRSLVS
jgi:type I restriction enzyme S subunit